jgi:hypothetical protein
VSTCDVVIDVFSALDASSRCLSGVVTVPRAFVGSLGPDEILAFCHATTFLWIVVQENFGKWMAKALLQFPQ